jgi:hypothetical protein
MRKQLKSSTILAGAILIAACTITPSSEVGSANTELNNLESELLEGRFYCDITPSNIWEIGQLMYLDGDAREPLFSYSQNYARFVAEGVTMTMDVNTTTTNTTDTKIMLGSDLLKLFGLDISGETSTKYKVTMKTRGEAYSMLPAGYLAEPVINGRTLKAEISERLPIWQNSSDTEINPPLLLISAMSSAQQINYRIQRIVDNDAGVSAEMAGLAEQLQAEASFEVAATGDTVLEADRFFPEPIVLCVKYLKIGPNPSAGGDESTGPGSEFAIEQLDKGIEFGGISEPPNFD